jgi:hypothetical protein
VEDLVEDLGEDPVEDIRAMTKAKKNTKTVILIHGWN